MKGRISENNIVQNFTFYLLHFTFGRDPFDCAGATVLPRSAQGEMAGRGARGGHFAEGRRRLFLPSPSGEGVGEADGRGERGNAKAVRPSSGAPRQLPPQGEAEGKPKAWFCLREYYFYCILNFTFYILHFTFDLRRAGAGQTLRGRVAYAARGKGEARQGGRGTGGGK